jgi:purine-binding chemotaxis protein CheW
METKRVGYSTRNKPPMNPSALNNEAQANRDALPDGGPPASTSRSSVHVWVREFLAFKLDAVEFGIDILRVQEIRSYEAPTRIASAPPQVLGVVNLRGVIVPIVDMRLCFKLEPASHDSFTVIVVLNIGSRVIGVVVDSVSDVITFTSEQLRPVPEFNTAIEVDHLLAIGAIGQRMLILIDIDRLMTNPKLGLVDASVH